MKKRIVLKSNSFTYPTQIENQEIDRQIPKIYRLNIEHKSAFMNYLKSQNIHKAIKEEDIYWWNLCLNNRFGKLEQTYGYVVTHYKRLKEYEILNSENVYTENFLFDYYTEIFYYYYFSSRDILGQLLNSLFEIEYDESKIYFNETFIKKISNEKIKEDSLEFLSLTSDSYKKYRNAFNHRFTPNLIDNRAKMTTIIKDSGNEINFGTAKEISKSEFYNDIHKLMEILSNYTESLSEQINNTSY